MKNKLPMLLLLVFVWLGTPCRAFLKNDMRLLTMKNGLLDNTIHSICKDHQGFVWLGTRDGLNRFDGKRIRSFLLDKESNQIDDLCEPVEGLLCFRSRDTLHAFDIRTERFLPVVEKEQGIMVKISTSAIIPDKDGGLWMLTNDSLLLMRPAYSEGMDTLVLRTERCYDFVKQESLNAPLTQLALSGDGRHLCIADRDGQLLVADMQRAARCKVIDLGVGRPLSITHLLYDDSGYIWVSTIAHGIIRYDIRTGRKEQLTYHGKYASNRLSHTDAFGVARLEPNRYLAVTWNGYTVITLDKDNPDRITTDVFNNTTSPIFRDIETRMISVYYDPQGILWIGTDGGGGIYTDLRNQLYKRFYQDSHNEICAIVSDDDGYLWLATYHEGLMRSVAPFSEDEEPDFRHVATGGGTKERTVLCAAKDSHGNLWFGNADGSLTRYHIRTKHLETIRPDNGQGFTNRSAVWSLLADGRGRLWIGTEEGLLELDILTQTCHQVDFKDNEGKPLPPLHIRALAETRDQSVWLGTTTGVCRYDGQSDRLETGYEQRRNMSGKSVRSLLAGSDGKLYIGYMDAFAILSPGANSIERVFTTQDGLCNNFIGCLTEDNQGDIWLGSNSGITHFNRKALFYNYYISGSNRSVFFWKGFLFWGNNKNLTYFSLDRFNRFEKPKRVLITELKVNNRPVDIGQTINRQAILPEGVSYVSSIRLNHANRNFSVAFSNLSYSDEEQMYAYRLYPIQQEWIYTRSEEQVSFTNLEKGEYVFEVRNLLADSSPGTGITSLRVTVEPHWTDTWLFRLFAFLATCLVAFVVYSRIRHRNKRLAHEMQLEYEVFTAQMERDNEKKLRMERERFFTEITHELRTPLTLIMAPLHELLQTAGLPAQVAHKVRLAYDNSRSLHVLMDQLLYVRKMEVNMLKLRVTETDITALLKDTCHAFEAIAEAGHYQFRTDLPTSPYRLWVDAEKLEMVIRNLLSNAFKYTPPQGTVQLSVGREQIDGHPFCRITISDNGRGIPADMKGKLFEPYQTGDNKPSYSTQTGIGMRIVKNIADLHHGYVKVTDAEGGGTVVRLYIPEGNTHFDENTAKEIRPTETRPAMQPTETSAEPTDKKRLLVIDDNADIRQYVCSLFADKFLTDEADNGEEGVRRASENTPDLIICDIMMPVMDGLECCRQLKSSPRTASVPVLMLTAKTEDVDAIRALKTGADDYMMKPFNPEMLKMKVESLLRQHERLERLYAGMLKLKHEEGKEPKEEDYFIQQVMQTIEANLADEKFNVKALADALCMSQPTLYRKIKQHSRLNAIDMIRTMRMSKAASLILENRYTLQEIAEMVGYNDVRTLRKHFIAQFGVAPSKYEGEK